MGCFYDTTPELQAAATAYMAAYQGPQAAVSAMKAASKAASAWTQSTTSGIPQSVIDATGVAKQAILGAGMDAGPWSAYQLALWALSSKRVATMEQASVVVDQSGYTKAGGIHVASSHPIVDAYIAAPAGSLVKVAAGAWDVGAWKNGSHVAGEAPVRFRGVCDPADPTKRSVFLRHSVGGSGSLGWGPGQGNVEFEDFDIHGSDLSCVSTTKNCLPHYVFRRCNVFGEGSAYDPNWGVSDFKTKWGMFTNWCADWTEEDVAVFSIIIEHAHYWHNIQGDLNLIRGYAKHCGRTAFQVFNRMSEGPEGKGDILIQDHDVIDCCIGDMGLGGGTAYTFAGGMKDSNISIVGGKTRLGCDPQLATPFQNGITGAIVCFSSPETQPGKGDQAYPGGQNELLVRGRDIEIGTVYPGKGSAIRPAIDLTALKVATLDSFRCKVMRPAGSHNIALNVRSDFTGELRIMGDNEVDGMVTYKDETLYQDWASFRSAHPELFVAPWV